MCFCLSAEPLRAEPVAYDKFPCLFKLASITLSLPRTGSRQEDIFNLLIDVLLPRSKPGNGIIVLNRPPLSRNVGYWYRGVFREIKRDIFWAKSVFQCTLLWVFSSSSE
jgi:hypothetical protein